MQQTWETRSHKHMEHVYEQELRCFHDILEYEVICNISVCVYHPFKSACILKEETSLFISETTLSNSGLRRFQTQSEGCSCSHYNDLINSNERSS